MNPFGRAARIASLVLNASTAATGQSCRAAVAVREQNS